MRRYLVFTYYRRRPRGGYNDFLDTFSTVEEALDNLLPEPGRHYQIVDRNTLQVVLEGRAEALCPGGFRFEEGE